MSDISDRVRLLIVMHNLKQIDNLRRLHNLVYLMKRMKGVGFSYNDFQYCVDGPYSSELQRDFDILCALGVVRKIRRYEDGYFTTTEKCEWLAQNFRGNEEYERIHRAVSDFADYDTATLIALSKRVIALFEIQV